MKLHPVFHVSLLEPALDDIEVQTKLPDDYLIEKEGLDEIEKILDHSDEFEERYYLIKWKKQDDLENT